MNNFMIDIRNKTNVLHKAAESSGFTKKLLNKEASKESYIEYIYNLYFVYEAIEHNLDKLENNESVKPFVTKEIYRAAEIKKDIEALNKDNSIEKLASTIAYVDRINSIVEKNPKYIIAPAYTRFLADLFGGRIFYSILQEHYNLEDTSLNYYVYKDLKDMKAYVMNYHNMLNTLELTDAEKEEFLIEISNSYIYNMAMSNELDAKNN